MPDARSIDAETFDSAGIDAADLDGAAIDAPADPPPDTSILTGPAATIGTASVTFELASTPAGATFECRVDGATFTACTSPHTEVVAQGAHTFEARAVGPGGADPSPASWAWVYDVDECTAGTHGCSATARCLNSIGSHACIGDDAPLCFDGLNDHGRSGALPAAVAALDAATVELWFRASRDDVEHNVISFDPTVVSDDRRVTIALSTAAAQGFSSLSGRVLHVTVDARSAGGALNARGFDLDASLASFDERAWHHYAVVFTGATQRAFVDGVELATAQQRDGSAATSFDDAFGAAYAGAGGTVTLDLGWFRRDSIRAIAGQLEDVRLSTGARYTGPYAVEYPLALDASTVLLYALDEGAGDSVDASSAAVPMTWAAPTWGACASALDFDGVDDVLSSTVPLARGLTSTIAIEHWLRPDAIGPWMGLLNIHNGDDLDVHMELRPDGKVYCTLFDQSPAGTPGKNHITVSSTVLSAGAWVHVACTYDGSTQRLFINGALESTLSWTGQVQLNDYVTISGFESRFLDGALDEFRLSGATRYTAAFTPPAHLEADASAIVVWKLDEGTGTTSADLSGNGFGARLGSGPITGGPPEWTPPGR